MSATAYPDSYYADIPMQADSVDIDYCVFAKDASGRRSFRPPVAPAAWYTFNTGEEDASGVVARGMPELGGFSLAQNSPNPVRSVTEIRYSLPVACHIRLEVYDVTGRHVAALVDEYQEAGTRVVSWDSRSGVCGNLAGGVYFLRFRAGGHTKTRRLILLR
jgi:hypothetical protein